MEKQSKPPMWDILASLIVGVSALVAAGYAIIGELGGPGWLETNPVIYGGGVSAGGVTISFLLAAVGLGLVWRSASLWRERKR